MRAYGLFRYWSDGNHAHEVHPDPAPKVEAFPFHVGISGKGHVAVSALVFACNEAQAWTRIETALKQCAEKSYNDSRAKTILDRLASGEYWKTVEPYDTDKICCTVNWASNGGVT